MIRYYLASLASGVLWAILALVVGEVFDLEPYWGGVAMTPLIGVLIGSLSRPVHQKPMSIRVLFSVATVYIGMTLFGLCDGLWELSTGQTTGDPWPLHLGTTTFAYAYVTTVLPTMWFVFPLAIINHLLLGGQFRPATALAGSDRGVY